MSSLGTQQSSDLDDHTAKLASYFAEEELAMKPFPPGPRAGSGGARPGAWPPCPEAVHSAVDLAAAEGGSTLPSHWARPGERYGDPAGVPLRTAEALQRTSWN